jgi:hypothetical protein
MITGIIALGGLYYALKDEKLSDATPTAPTTPDAPQEPPKPLTPEGDNIRFVEAGQGDGGVISLLQMRRGLMYDDGSGGYSWEDSGYVRGSPATGFISAPRFVGGSISITFEGTEYKHVLVYPSLEAAQEADKKEETDPNDPTQPQKPPEPEEDKPSNPKPNLPPFGGFGGGVSNPFGGM